MILGTLSFLECLKVFSGLVFASLFLQSGLDKIFDYKGNKSWILSYFEASPLKRLSNLLFTILMGTELLAGAFCLAGAGLMIFSKNEFILRIGIGLASVALLFVFTGQRIAKDYTSAANTIAYLAAAMIAGLIVAQ
jgi:putative oxidoreductase